MSEPMKLLNEECLSETKTEFLEEAATGQKRMYITGVFLGAEKRNRNGRIYPKHLIEREVQKYQKLIENHEALGELSHPETGDINPDRAAILITDLHMDNDFAIGKAKVLSTPCGKILESLISDGVKMGVSSRGTGNLLEDNIVADDFNLITIDSVYLPSCMDAYSSAIYESVQTTSEWVLNESTGLYVEKLKKIDKATETFNKKVDDHGSKVIVDAFKEWLDTLTL